MPSRSSLRGERYSFRRAPAMPENYDPCLLFFVRRQRAVVVSIQAPQNFGVGPVGVTVRETLYIHAFGVFIAQVFDNLHRAVHAVIVLDEAADETDHHGGRGGARLS